MAAVSNHSYVPSMTGGATDTSGPQLEDVHVRAASPSSVGHATPSRPLLALAAVYPVELVASVERTHVAPESLDTLAITVPALSLVQATTTRAPYAATLGRPPLPSVSVWVVVPSVFVVKVLPPLRLTATRTTPVTASV